MNTVKTMFDLGGEREEERMEEASEVTNSTQYIMGSLPVPLQVSGKATKLDRCFA